MLPTSLIAHLRGRLLALAGWPLTIGVPVVALLMDRYIVAENSLLFGVASPFWRLRAFVYVVLGATITAFIATHRGRSVPALWSAAAAGMIATGAMIVCAVGVWLAPIAWWLAKLGVAGLFLATVDALRASKATAGPDSLGGIVWTMPSLMTIHGVADLLLLPSFVALVFEAERRYSSTRETRTMVRHRAGVALGMVGTLGLAASVQAAPWLTPPPLSVVDRMPEAYAAKEWLPQRGSDPPTTLPSTREPLRCRVQGRWAPSPNDAHVAGFRHVDDWRRQAVSPFMGQYELHLCDRQTGADRRILLLEPFDAWEGRSFDIFWAADSTALRIAGQGAVAGRDTDGGFWPHGAPREWFEAVYPLRDHRWYYVTQPNLGLSPNGHHSTTTLSSQVRSFGESILVLAPAKAGARWPKATPSDGFSR